MADEALKEFALRIVRTQQKRKSVLDPNDSGQLKEEQFDPNFAALERLGLTLKKYDEYFKEAEQLVGSSSGKEFVPVA